jgi:hypothetical protein
MIDVIWNDSDMTLYTVYVIIVFLELELAELVISWTGWHEMYHKHRDENKDNGDIIGWTCWAACIFEMSTVTKQYTNTNEI